MVCGGKSSFGVAAGLIISVVLVSCTFPKLEVAPGYKGESSTSASSWLGGRGWFGAAATEIGALPRMILAVGVVILAGVCLWQRQDKEIACRIKQKLSATLAHNSVLPAFNPTVTVHPVKPGRQIVLLSNVAKLPSCYNKQHDYERAVTATMLIVDWIMKEWHESAVILFFVARDSEVQRLSHTLQFSKDLHAVEWVWEVLLASVACSSTTKP